jgi:hypothetical protein
VFSAEAVLEFNCQFLGSFNVYVGRNDFYPYLRQAFASGPADAQGSAGNDSDFIFQIQPAHQVVTP